MMKSKDRLYLLTGEWDIKTYDLNDKKVIRSIELPDKDKVQKGTFYVMDVVEASGTLYIQAGTYEFDKSHVYQFKDDKIIQLGLVPPFNRIVGADKDYIYVTERKGSERVEGEKHAYDYQILGFRYDKQLKNRGENHFDDYPGMIITDIWEDGDKNWYAGIAKPYGDHPEILRGKPFLLSKDQHSGRSVLHELGEQEFALSYHKGPSIAGDEDSIWIVGAEVRLRDSDIYKIIKFSKGKGIIERNERPLEKRKGYSERLLNTAISLVKERTENKHAQFLWFFEPSISFRAIFRFDKEAFVLSSFATQNEVTLLQSIMGNSICIADDNYIWMAVIQYQNPGEGKGHLLRISQADASYEVIPVFSKTKDIIKRIELFSIIAALILGPLLSLILGFSNIPKLKYLKGWKPTAAIIICSIVLAILNPQLEAISGRYSFLFVIPLLGLAPILISRSLTYLVKLTKFKRSSWVLAVSLSLFSGGLFGLLFLSAYRFVSGEAGLGLLVIAMWGASFVSFISLIVNIRERIS